MSLLDHYLKAVRIYLPNHPEKDDILSELAEHLRVKMDERQAELGRPLTETEQEQVLTRHGNPSVVATQYGAANLGLAFGRQLIGPELFPLYLRLLLAQFAVTVVVVTAVDLFVQQRLGSLARYLVPMTFQFVVGTLIFAVIDGLQRRDRSRSAGGERPSWSFPPSYLQPIPRWQSAAGAICLGLTTAWWAAVPYAPMVVFGGAAQRLHLGAAWATFYWPLLVLLLVGVGQRLATLARPEWNWLQSATRLVTNGLAVALLYPLLQTVPYVLAVDAGDAGAVAMARRINGGIWWSLLTCLGLYWLITAGFMAFMCAQHLAYFRRRRRSREPQTSRGFGLS